MGPDPDTDPAQAALALRASDADRDAVVRDLNQHHLAGRLTVDELAERLEGALRARTRADLQRLTRDLPALAPPPAAWGTRRRGPAPGLAYAGFWVRAGAWAVDGVISVGIAWTLSAHGAGPFAGAEVPLYYVGAWAWRGQTPGMWPKHLRVVRAEDGGPIGPGRALIRGAGCVVNVCSGYLGFAWAGWDPHKQGWHDKLANTLVVRPAPPGSGPALPGTDVMRSRWGDGSTAG